MNPQVAVADHRWSGLTGSWLVAIDPKQPPGLPPFTNLATVNWDGTIVTSDPVAGGGHGAWKRTGRRQFEVKFLVLVPPVLPPNTLPPVLAGSTLNMQIPLEIYSYRSMATSAGSVSISNAGGDD
jgi:hypothetical protein